MQKSDKEFDIDKGIQEIREEFERRHEEVKKEIKDLRKQMQRLEREREAIVATKRILGKI